MPQIISNKKMDLPLNKMRSAILMLIGILIAGVVGYTYIEGLTVLDALYLTLVTITTVGYGDIVTHTIAGKIFTICLITIGVGMAAYTFSLTISLVLEGQLTDVLGRRGMKKKIAKMNNHIIVCGSGRVGHNIIERLIQENQDFVVVEDDERVCERLIEQGVLVVDGDATLDEVLLDAGLQRAQGIISALPTDSENVYVTLTSKSLNHGINIVARADRPEAEEKLRRAGASTVIFPSVMAGRQMVTAMTKPVIMDLMENVFYNEELHLDIAQITVSATSPLVGKTLVESNIKKDFESIIVAIKRGEQLISNPLAIEKIYEGDILIVLGQRDPLNGLNQLALQ